VVPVEGERKVTGSRCGGEKNWPNQKEEGNKNSQKDNIPHYVRGERGVIQKVLTDDNLTSRNQNGKKKGKVADLGSPRRAAVARFGKERRKKKKGGRCHLLRQGRHANRPPRGRGCAEGKAAGRWREKGMGENLKMRTKGL